MKQYVRCYIHDGGISEIETQDAPFHPNVPYAIDVEGKTFTIAEFEYEDIWQDRLIRARALLWDLEIKQEHIEMKPSVLQPGTITKRKKRDHRGVDIPLETKIGPKR